MDVLTFFEQALPKVVSSRSQLFDAGRGVVCIIVHGVGAWTLRFGDHAAPDAIEATLDLDADLVVTWSEDQFQLLLSDNPDAEAVMPLHIGEVTLLSQLGNLLMPTAQGGLGARLRF